MKTLLQKYKILLVIVFFGVLFFVDNNVLAVASDKECIIIKYDNGGGFCSTEAGTGEEGYWKNVGIIFKKGDYLKSKSQMTGGAPVPVYSNYAEDNGTRLPNGNCFENINYCYFIFEDNSIIDQWVDLDKEFMVGAPIEIEVNFNKNINFKDNPAELFYLGGNQVLDPLKIDCNNLECKATVKIGEMLPVGDYIIKYLYIIDKNTNPKVNYHEYTIRVKPVDCSIYDGTAATCNQNKFCFSVASHSYKCYLKQDISICKSLPKDYCTNSGTNGSQACVWSVLKKECVSNFVGSIEDRYKVPEGYDGPLPDCAFAGDCNDVNQLLELVINIGKWFFSIIGSLAFVFFVYGGFTMILSFGSAEKFKKGQQVLVAAVIGMVIAFGAYALVNFLLVSLGVSGDLIFIK